MAADAADQIRALVADTPGLATALGAILDRRELIGRMPARLTLPAAPACATALAALFSSRAVRAAGDGRVRIDLAAADAVVCAQEGAGLDAVLYRALARSPRDPAAEDGALRARLAAGLAARSPTSPAARGFLADEHQALAAGRGDLLAAARARGADAALAFVADIARGIDAVLANREPVRRATFAARVFGDSKILAAGGELARAIGLALVEHDPQTRDDVLAQLRDRGDETAVRLAFASHGVFRDEGTITVHCFGPLIYHKGGARFDEVARHAALGDVAALTLQQLRGAALDAPIDRAVVLENQATFLDYVERPGRPPRELVVLGRGQATYAVVALLRLVARAAPIVVACDLDRSGVLIWRSLARRSSAALVAVGMDAATHARVADRGRPLAAAERARLAALLAVDPPDAPGHDLLRAIHERDRWVEQEAFAADVLFPALDLHAHA